ncbi:hypothetical protein HDU93_008246 [Gonapodya sp. JEL0774]|nr:hypothetical protein HDU93_008246 [Gonapodya sp. JEL0774]
MDSQREEMEETTRPLLADEQDALSVVEEESMGAAPGGTARRAGRLNNSGGSGAFGAAGGSSVRFADTGEAAQDEMHGETIAGDAAHTSYTSLGVTAVDSTDSSVSQHPRVRTRTRSHNPPLSPNARHTQNLSQFQNYSSFATTYGATSSSNNMTHRTHSTSLPSEVFLDFPDLPSPPSHPNALSRDGGNLPPSSRYISARRASFDDTVPSLPGAYVSALDHHGQPPLWRAQSGRRQILPGTVLNVPKPDGKVQPQRTTKTTQKLVALPNLAPLAYIDDASDPSYDYMFQNEAPFAGAGANTGGGGTVTGFGEDEDLFGRDRDEDVGALFVAENEILVPDVGRGDAPPPHPTPLPRVTGYCTADSYSMPRLQALFESQGRKWRTYDEAAYVVVEDESSPDMSTGSASTSPTRPTSTPSRQFGTPPTSPMSPTFPTSPFSIATAAGAGSTTASAAAVLPRRDLFIFAFGVVVFWGFTEAEEKKWLGVIQKEAQETLERAEWQIEDLKFEYQADIGEEGGRIYNDVLTLRTHHHLAKLTLSHAVAQSVKLAVYESLLLSTLSSTRRIPQQMATQGEVDLSREEIVRVMGGLFRVRTEVNLVSNVLDSPELFWDRPELAPLYNSMRIYLEITQRASVLNHRALVISDLVDVLTEHLNHSKMDTITWIIIWLIVVDVIVMVMEVVVKAFKATKPGDVVAGVGRLGVLRFVAGYGVSM